MASKLSKLGFNKRGGVWHLRTDPVTKKPISTKCRNLEAAHAFRAKRELLAANPAYAASQTARLDDWIDRVIASKAELKRSAATLSIYATKLGHWLRFAPNALLHEVTPTFVDTFVKQRRTEDVTDHTIRKEVDHLVIVMRAAERAGEYAGNCDTLCPPDLQTGYEPRERALTRDELFRLLSELKPELMAVVAIAVALGCRLAEIFRMLPTDISWELSLVHVRGTKTKLSKRTLPILSLFTELLRAASAYLPLGELPNNLYRDLAAACARAGITNATPNDFRRTHATLLAEAGVDADVTRRLLGHTTRALVDRIYARPRPEALGALAEVKLLTAAPLQKRDSEQSDQLENVDILRADFEIRTRDLRFTKPLTPLSKAAGPQKHAVFSSPNAGERGRTRAFARTDSLQPIPVLALALAAERVLL